MTSAALPLTSYTAPVTEMCEIQRTLLAVTGEAAAALRTAVLQEAVAIFEQAAQPAFKYVSWGFPAAPLNPYYGERDGGSCACGNTGSSRNFEGMNAERFFERQGFAERDFGHMDGFHFGGDGPGFDGGGFGGDGPGAFVFERDPARSAPPGRGRGPFPVRGRGHGLGRPFPASMLPTGPGLTLPVFPGSAVPFGPGTGQEHDSINTDASKADKHLRDKPLVLDIPEVNVLCKPALDWASFAIFSWLSIHSQVGEAKLEAWDLSQLAHVFHRLLNCLNSSNAIFKERVLRILTRILTLAHSRVATQGAAVCAALRIYPDHLVKLRELANNRLLKETKASEPFPIVWASELLGVLLSFLMQYDALNDATVVTGATLQAPTLCVADSTNTSFTVRWTSSCPRSGPGRDRYHYTLEVAKVAPPKCKKGHEMKAFITACGTTCDRCQDEKRGGKMPSGVPMYGCRLCNYDLCPNSCLHDPEKFEQVFSGPALSFTVSKDSPLADTTVLQFRVRATVTAQGTQQSQHSDWSQVVSAKPRVKVQKIFWDRNIMGGFHYGGTPHPGHRGDAMAVCNFYDPKFTFLAEIGFKTGVHYWKIQVKRQPRSSDTRIGLVTGGEGLNRSAEIEKVIEKHLMLPLGTEHPNLKPVQSWGIQLTDGTKLISGSKTRDKIQKWPPVSANSTYLFRLDCDQGQLSLVADGVDLGVVFDNLPPRMEIIPACTLGAFGEVLAFDNATSPDLDEVLRPTREAMAFAMHVTAQPRAPADFPLLELAFSNFREFLFARLRYFQVGLREYVLNTSEKAMAHTKLQEGQCVLLEGKFKASVLGVEFVESTRHDSKVWVWVDGAVAPTNVELKELSLLPEDLKRMPSGIATDTGRVNRESDSESVSESDQVDTEESNLWPSLKAGRTLSSKGASPVATSISAFVEAMSHPRWTLQVDICTHMRVPLSGYLCFI